MSLAPIERRRRLQQRRARPSFSRLQWASLTLWSGLAIASLQLIRLQAFQAEALRERAADQHQVLVRPFVPRRAIVDRHSLGQGQAEYLALDESVFSLWVRPILFNYDPQVAAQMAAAVAPILGRDVNELTQLMSKRHSVRLGYWLPRETARQIRALFFDGLELVEERQRIYPQNELAAGVVGYVDLEHRGQAGVELLWQTRLERERLALTVSRDGNGFLQAATVPPELFEASETVLQLTLDMQLQRTAHRALQVQLERFQAKRGAAIVMDAHTGELLVVATVPSYDPNRYFEVTDLGLFRNWAVTDLYEPGSTFKPLVAAIALDAGTIQPTSTFFDEGRIMVGGWPIQNYDYRERGAYGLLTLSQVLQFSSNVGMVHIIDTMTRRQFYDGLLSLGFGQRTGVDLPSEPPSHLKDEWQFLNVPIEAATTSFGQGFAVTPLQLVQMHAMIANGGYRVTPHVVRGLVDRDTDQLVWSPSLPESERVFSASSTLSVRQFMADVVISGTGRSVAIDGYDIGGKTGTAQKADPSGAGYLDDAKITSFVGYYPALEPRYVILAVVDNPVGDDAFGSTVAAPIVRALISEIITQESLLSPAPAVVVPD